MESTKAPLRTLRDLRDFLDFRAILRVVARSCLYMSGRGVMECVVSRSRFYKAMKTIFLVESVVPCSFCSASDLRPGEDNAWETLNTKIIIEC